MISTDSFNESYKVMRGHCRPSAAFISGGEAKHGVPLFYQARLFCRACVHSDNRKWLSEGSLLIPKETRKVVVTSQD